MRLVVRTLIAAFLIAAPLLVTSAAPASAQVNSDHTSRTPSGLSSSPTISITSMTPDWAGSGTTVTVKGTITNNTGSPISGIDIGLQTWQTPLEKESDITGFVNGTELYYNGEPVGTAYALPRTLHTGVTMNWSVSFPAKEADYQGTGVYPVTAAAYTLSEASPLATARTPLPYWPGGKNASPGTTNVSWVWPLIDTPQQGACPQTLTSDSLNQSLAKTGRLGGLLNAGLQYGDKADITWAVDPSLLNDVSTMSEPYKVGGSSWNPSSCTGTTGEPASSTASSWLNALRSATADEPLFVTPYADTDVSALTHAGLESDVRTSFSVGDSVARDSLHGAFGENGSGTGINGAPSVAWPNGGTADESTLTALADSGDISTVLLGSDAVPSATSAVGSTTSGIGTSMNVVLADSGLTSVLGSSTATSSAGQQFATEQEFVAETAVLASAGDRSVVVAPPQRWDPSEAEASALLSSTDGSAGSAPWLHTEALSSLVSAAKSDPQPVKLPGDQVTSGELSSRYLDDVKYVNKMMGMYRDLLYQPDSGTVQKLEEAQVSTESAAWRGSGGSAGFTSIIDLENYLSDSESKIQIITAGGKTAGGKLIGNKVLLAGASADLPVSVKNGLNVPIEVKVSLDPPRGGELSIGKFSDLMPVEPGKTGTVKVPVHTTGIETTTMELQLVTRNGSPLTWTQQPMTVQVLRYGQALPLVIFGALGVLVLTAAVRWVRRWLNGTKAGSGGTA
ncbi:MAG TPA: DUF6049 family protein [Trebonia sp.]